MCFVLKTEEDLSVEPKIAQFDIPCYKTGEWRGLIFEAMFYYKIYGFWSFFFCEKVNLKIDVEGRDGNFQINYGKVYRGYHSYTKSYKKACKFIIPKGTRYYENETEYVSERILRRSIWPI